MSQMACHVIREDVPTSPRVCRKARKLWARHMSGGVSVPCVNSCARPNELVVAYRVALQAHVVLVGRVSDWRCGVCVQCIEGMTKGALINRMNGGAARNRTACVKVACVEPR